ncbi:MAG: 50S ribosomal protein L24 [Candidatus Niyogibacteria bacterium]|nr:50S ribosomal protein L24 [Candidatus Niyogibacteria bacterium]
MTFFIKKNDKVKILSGKDRGKEGRVLKVSPEEERVVIEGVNVRKKHRRPRRQGEKGQTIQIPLPVHASNVMLVCPSCSKPTRAKRFSGEGMRKLRVCRKCKAEIS